MKRLTLIFITLFLFFSNLHSQNQNFNLITHWPEGPATDICPGFYGGKFLAHGASISVIESPIMAPLRLFYKINTIAKQMIYSDSLLFILGRKNNMSIYQPSLSKFEEIASFALDEYGRAEYMVLNKNFLYIGTNHSLLIFDVSNARQPEFLKSLDIPVFSLALKDSILIVGSYELKIFKLHAPDSLTLISTLDLFTQYPSRFAWRDNYLYVAGNSFTTCICCSGEFFVIDVSDVSNPEIKSSLAVPTDCRSGTNGVTVNDSIAFVGYFSDLGNGIMVVDVKDAENPRILNSRLAADDPKQLMIDHDILYVVDNYNGLLKYIISEPQHIELIHQEKTGGASRGLFVKDSLVFLANGKCGLKIFELKTINLKYMLFPFSSLDNSHFTPFDLSDLVVHEQRAYLLNTSKGLYVVDVSDLKQPKEIAFLDSIGGYHLNYSGNHLFVADRNKGLIILDVSQAEQPVVVFESNEANDFGRDIQVVDSVLFYLNQAGIRIYKIKDPHQPELLSELNKKWITSFDVFLNILVIAYFEISANQELLKMSLFDISDLTNPVELSTNTFTHGYLTEIEITENVIFSADYHNGLRVYSFDKTGDIQEIGNYSTLDIAQAIAVDDKFIYLSDNDDGLYVFDRYLTNVATNSVPEDFLLFQNYPNPFNQATTIVFQIPFSGLVTLNIYNILGQKIRTILRGNLLAGKHRIHFNAVELSSGVYIYQLEFRSNSGSGKLLKKSGKMLLIK